MDRAKIRELALQCGFKLKPQDDGSEDLNEYVYRFADIIFSKGYQSAQQTTYGPIKSCTDPECGDGYGCICYTR